MARKIKIECEKIVVTATLLEDKAPETSKAILQVLPLEAEAVHSRWSGDVIRVPAEQLPINLGLENQTIYPSVGDIAWNPGLVSIVQEIFFVYGQARFGGRMGPIPSNLFAKVTDNLEGLGNIGAKIFREGAKKIMIMEKPTRE